MTQGKGSKFENSIGAQVARAVKNANITPGYGSAEQAHESRRNAKGQVPKGLQTGGKFKRSPIAISEREELARKKKLRAGQAKGAWVEASNKIDGKKMSGVAQWISRHDAGGYGDATKAGSGLKYTIELINRTSYIKKIQSGKAIAQAVAYGLKNGYKRMAKIIEKEIEKANRANA
jgi:hypothetical protein